MKGFPIINIEIPFFIFTFSGKAFLINTTSGLNGPREGFLQKNPKNRFIPTPMEKEGGHRGIKAPQARE